MVSYEFLWIGRTCDYILLSVHYCVLISIVGLEFGLDLVSGLLVVTHTYLHSFPLSLYRPLNFVVWGIVKTPLAHPHEIIHRVGEKRLNFAEEFCCR